MAMHIICFVLGIVSLTLSLIISVSQIVSLLKTKNTSGVSIGTYAIFMVAGAMCLVWGFSYYFQEMQIKEIPGQGQAPYWLYQGEIIPIISYYITDFCLSTTMTIIKGRHMYLSKRLHISEIELADYLKDWDTEKSDLHKKYFHRSGLAYSSNFPIIIILTLLFLIVVAFAICFTIFARPPYIEPAKYGGHLEDGVYVCDGAGFPGVLPCSLCAALLGEAISGPQFIQSLRSKDTSGISMNGAIFMPISLTVSFAYALALALKFGDFAYDTLGALIFNGMIVNYGILVLKCINRKKAKKLGMTELAYTRTVLIPAGKKKVAAKKRAKAIKLAEKRRKKLEKNPILQK